MAKKTEIQTQNELTLKNIEESTELILKNSKDLLVNIISDTHIKELEDNYLKAAHGGLKDLKGFNYIVDGLKHVKSIEREISKTRKKITDPALKFQKEMIQVEKDLLEKINPITLNLETQKNNFEDLQKAEENRVLMERNDRLIEAGFEIIGSVYKCGIMQVDRESLMGLSEEDIVDYENSAKEHHAMKKAEAERLEAERLKLKEDAENLRLEKEKMAAELKELQELRAMKAELEAEKLRKVEPAPVEKPVETPVEEKPTPENPEPTKMEKAGIAGFGGANKTVPETLKNAPSPAEAIEGKPVMSKKNCAYDIALNDVMDFILDKKVKLTRKTLVAHIAELRIFKADSEIEMIKSKRDVIMD